MHYDIQIFRNALCIHGAEMLFFAARYDTFTFTKYANSRQRTRLLRFEYGVERLNTLFRATLGTTHKLRIRNTHARTHAYETHPLKIHNFPEIWAQRGSNSHWKSRWAEPFPRLVLVKGGSTRRAELPESDYISYDVNCLKKARRPCDPPAGGDAKHNFPWSIFASAPNCHKATSRGEAASTGITPIRHK